MAAIVGYKVEGLNKVVRDLQTFGLEVDDLKDAFSAIAREGAEVAAGFAPRRTGRLADSIRGNRAKSKAVVTAGKKAVPYAGPQNYGWGNLHANWKGGKYASGIKGSFRGHFFMQKADQVMSPVALQRLQEEIDEAIRKRGLA